MEDLRDVVFALGLLAAGFLGLLVVSLFALLLLGGVFGSIAAGAVVVFRWITGI